jgi:thymidylate kinase
MLTVESTLRPPKLATELFDALNQSGISYCHWKSNELIAQGLVGETDLDLLIERSSFSATVALLLNCGFKQAALLDGSGTPGVLHFYAFDEGASDWLHVHLYSRLLTGESLVKSHILPCEAILLRHGTRIGEVRVPSLEAEAAVCLLRAFLKKGALLHALLHGKHEPRNERDVVLFPDDAAAAEAAYRSLTMCCRAIDRELFLNCYRALAEDWPSFQQWLLGVKVRRQLQGYARYTAVGRFKAYLDLVVGKLRRLGRDKRKNKVLESGGAVIAFIGGDATGKSTLVKESTQWVGHTFAVRTLHLGKPPHTWVTFPLRITLPIARRLFPSQRHQAPQTIEIGPLSGKCRYESTRPPSLIYAIRALGLAWDRSRLVKKAHRAAAAGEIVICDRYPSDECGATDGPRLRVRTGERTWRTRLMNLFARCEQRLYRNNAPPDVALRLHVSIETAKRRNRQRTKSDRHSDDLLEARHQPHRAWTKTGTRVAHDFDTELSLAETLLSVKKAIWESL